MTDYCARADIENVFGITNAETWADLDNDGDAGKITARIASACAWATREINDRLRASIYVTPLVEDEGGALPETVVDLAANLAGVWLYEHRGVKDYNPDTGASVHRLQYQKDAANRVIRMVLAGQRQFKCTKDATEIPMVVGEATRPSDRRDDDYYQKPTTTVPETG